MAWDVCGVGFRIMALWIGDDMECLRQAGALLRVCKVLTQRRYVCSVWPIVIDQVIHELQMEKQDLYPTH